MSETSDSVWGIGLQNTEASALQRFAGDECSIEFREAAAAPAAGEDAPEMVWMAWSAWKELCDVERAAWAASTCRRRILILDEAPAAGSAKGSYDEALAHGFITAVRAPLEKEGVEDALFRAKEMAFLQDDIYQIASEMELHREILVEKNQILTFLTSVVGRAESNGMNPATIITEACDDLGLLHPVRTLQGAFWRENGDDSVDAELFMHCFQDDDIRAAWTDFLLETVTALSGREVSNYNLTYLFECIDEPYVESAPEPGLTLRMPLRSGDAEFGCLAAQFEEVFRPGKDKMAALQAACGHLGLALHNSLLHRDAKILSDYDGLTKLHGRRSFENRLTEELVRAERYDYDLSLLKARVENHASLSERYGSETADAAVKEIGSMLLSGMRSTDFTARIDSAEFSVLLPYADIEQAEVLARRLTDRIEAKRFILGERSFQVEVSVGVSSRGVDGAEDEADMLRLADKSMKNAAGRCFRAVAGSDAKAAVGCRDFRE